MFINALDITKWITLFQFCFSLWGLDSHLFTGDPRGVLKLWDIEDNLKINTQDFPGSIEVPLIAMFQSCFGARIMCIDASPKEEVLSYKKKVIIICNLSVVLDVIWSYYGYYYYKSLLSWPRYCVSFVLLCSSVI